MGAEPGFSPDAWPGKRQLSNANRAGANIRFVLNDVVDFLSNEQQIKIREYGSMLNPLSLFYMFSSIIAPSMGIIFLTIISTLVDLNISEWMFVLILLLLGVLQIMFIGLIKSRRPVVAL